MYADMDYTYSSRSTWQEAFLLQPLQHNSLVKPAQVLNSFETRTIALVLQDAFKKVPRGVAQIQEYGPGGAEAGNEQMLIGNILF